MLSTLLALVLLVAIPAEALWRTSRDQPLRSRIARYQSTIMKAAILLGLLLVVAYTENISAAALGLSLHLETAGLIGLAIGAFLCLGLGISTVMAKTAKDGSPTSDADILRPDGPRERIYFFGLVFIIGFAWEVLYRGFLLWWLVPIIGVAGAVLLSGLSYGLAHGWKDCRKGVSSIISALMFAAAYALTGSLWWLIMIHIALPVVGFLAARKQRVEIEHDGMESLT